MLNILRKKKARIYAQIGLSVIEFARADALGHPLKDIALLNALDRLNTRLDALAEYAEIPVSKKDLRQAIMALAEQEGDYLGRR